MTSLWDPAPQGVAASSVPSGVFSYTWSTRPAASSLPVGTEIIVTDSVNGHVRYFTNGASWIPVSGSDISLAYLACIPGRQFVTSGAPIDLSSNSNNGVLGASLTDAACWANKGYMTTSVGANINVSLALAKTTFDLSTQSCLFSCVLNKAAPAGNEASFGNADAATVQGFYVSIRTSGAARVVVTTSTQNYNVSADSSAIFADGTDHVLTAALDATTKQTFLWADGMLTNTTSVNWTGTTTPTVPFMLGAAAGGIGVAAKFSGVHLLKFSGALPSNITRVVAQLASRPFDYLRNADISP